jgi:ATP-dependent Clp protease ATP-binding subunit ClpA
MLVEIQGILFNILNIQTVEKIIDKETYQMKINMISKTYTFKYENSLKNFTSKVYY